MSNNKTRMSEDRNVISFEKIAKQTPASEPIFSKGLYHWVMFVLGYYSRVKNTLKIDFESFVILQVVVSHHLYELNKEGTKTFNEVETQIINAKRNKSKNKLTFASVSEVLQLPRETVRRKVLNLVKKKILLFNTASGITLGPGYKTIYKDFVSQTTIDLSNLLKKWKRTGALENLLTLESK